MKLPVIKKGKTGYSTDVSVLEKLSGEHKIADFLLQYRERQKLIGTYLEALPEMLNPEDKLIHTSFNQAVTSTGRLSSSNPNLQNVNKEEEDDDRDEVDQVCGVTQPVLVLGEVSECGGSPADDCQPAQTH